MRPIQLLSRFVPANSDLYVGLITSDFQVRVRWGFMGFDNASWDDSRLHELLYGDHVITNERVDINHKRGRTLTGYLVALKSGTTNDYTRLQADWTTPRPMDYVLGAFALPKASLAYHYALSELHRTARVGISIEHGGRKPKRTIGPCVTLTSHPWNLDCWMIYRDAVPPMFLYPDVVPVGKGKEQDLKLPESIRVSAEQLLTQVKDLPRDYC